MGGEGGNHYMKVTTYALPFRPPFFRSLENFYSFDPYILAKTRKMSYFDPYFSSKLGKMYSFAPFFFFLPFTFTPGYLYVKSLNDPLKQEKNIKRM